MRKKILNQVFKKEIRKKEAAEKLDVSRVTLNKWFSRYKRFGEEGLFPHKRKQYPPPKNKTSEEVEDKVILLAEQYWFDGVEILSDRLFAETEILLNPTTIYRILKRRGIRYDNSWVGTKKRKKIQLYSHKQAGKELQMDTKYPFGYKVGKVFYTVIDDASRWTYAKAYETANAENTVDFLKELIKRFPFDVQKIRTDCGTEFIAHKVLDHLKVSNIEHRKNTPYCPEENGKIERFHRTINEKLVQIHLSPSDSLEILDYKLSQFLHWYNFEKRHRGLGMEGLTPFHKLISLAFKNVNLTLQCNKI